MKLYIVLWDDRHTDVTAHPFLDFEEAKEWARKKAEDINKFPEDLEEKNYDEYLYCVQYTCEGDSLWITEHEIEEIE